MSEPTQGADDRSERRRILDLLAAGKITAAEAERLLNALGGGDQDAWSQLGGRAGELSNVAARVVAQVADGIGRHLRSETVGEPREWQGELEGEGPIELDIDVDNAGVEVVPGGDARRYRVVYTPPSGPLLDDPQVEVTGRRVRIRIRERTRLFLGVSVGLLTGGPRLRLELPGPPGTELRGRVRSENGSLRLSDLSLGDLTLQGTNGAVRVDVPEVGEVQARTVNGSIRVAARRGRVAHLGTVNGQVRLRGPFAQAELSSTNGRVEALAELPAGDEAVWSLATQNGQADLLVADAARWRYAVEASSQLGRAEVSLPGAQVVSESGRTLGGRQEAHGGDPSGPLLTAKVKAGNGNARVTQA